APPVRPAPVGLPRGCRCGGDEMTTREVLACIEVGGSSSQTIVFGLDATLYLDGVHQPRGARVALAVPGLIDGRRVAWASNLGWVDVDPLEALGLQGPAGAVCNDAEAAALGEAELRGMDGG